MALTFKRIYVRRYRDNESVVAIPKSGSRREAIEKLLDAARHLQTIRPDKANSVQAAINYMIMHDGW